MGAGRELAEPMMPSRLDGVSIGAFACVQGDVTCDARALPGFQERWGAIGSGADFGTMGCRTFRKMSMPVERYIADCVRRTLDAHGVAPEDVDHLVFSTMDSTLALVAPDLVRQVLDAVGLVSCLPVGLSYRQCCSSLAALIYAWELFADPSVENVVVVAFDFRAGDDDRIRPFALFGDAVTSCLVSRRPQRGFRLLASSVRIDYEGLMGNDSFASRQSVAQAALGEAYRDAGISAGEVIRIFPCNLFKPLTLFNAAAAGIETRKLHFSDTLARYGHCGNVDWMMNLVDYDDAVGCNEGEAFLALASAPGLFACSLLVASEAPV